VTFAALQGAHAVRVHDVGEMRQAVGLALQLRVVEA
jgi:dihydropteroate synthase